MRIKKIFSLFKKNKDNKKVYKISLPNMIETRDKARLIEDPNEALEERKKIEERLIANVVSKFVGAFEEVMKRHTKIIKETIDQSNAQLNHKIEESIKQVNKKISDSEERIKSSYEKIAKEKERKLYAILKEQGMVIPDDIIESIEESKEEEELDKEVTIEENVSSDFTEEDYSNLEEDDVDEFLGTINASDIEVDDEKVKEVEERGIVVSDIKPINWNYWIGYNSLHLFLVEMILKEKGEEFKGLSSLNNNINYPNISNVLKFSLEKRNNEIVFDDEFLKSFYEYTHNMYYYVHQNIILKSFLKNMKLESDGKISRERILLDIFLLSLSNFLLKKTIYDENSISHYSADNKVKEGLHSSISTKYKYYSNTFLFSHNASLIYFLLFIFFSNQKKYLNDRSVILIYISLLVHDIGKVYSSKISSHKDEDIWNVFLNDYFSYVEKQNLKERIDKFYPNNNLGDISFSEYKEFLTNSMEITFFSLVFKHHDTLIDPEVLSEDYYNLFKIVFYLDKYSRILENRFINFFSKNYSEANFNFSFEDFHREITGEKGFFKYIARGANQDYYSIILGTNINNSVHSLIVQNISDKGKKIFMQDIMDIFKFFISIESSKLSEHTFYSVEYIDSRKFYRVPLKSLVIEILSKGWIDLSSIFLKSFLSKDEDEIYNDVVNIKDLHFVFRKLGYSVDKLSQNLFIKDGYIWFSKDIAKLID